MSTSTVETGTARASGTPKGVIAAVGLWLGVLRGLVQRQGLRGRIVALAFFTCASVLIFAGALSYTHYLDERRMREDRFVEAAVALADAIDQEVNVGASLLKGLSASPALRSGDLQGFHKQLVETPVPDGSWLALKDAQGQVLNTLRPYGSRLPANRDFPDYEERLREEVDMRGVSVTNRLLGPLLDTFLIVVRLPIKDGAGRTTYLLQTNISEAGWRRLIKESGVAPAGAAYTLVDRKYAILAQSSGPVRAASQLPEHVIDELRSGPARGKFTTSGSEKPAIFSAYARAKGAGFTALLEVPMSAIASPLSGKFWFAGLGAIALLASSIGVALIAGRRAEQPLEMLKRASNAITDRLHAAERDLATTQSRYETYWNHIGEGLYAVQVTSDGRFVFESINPVHERLTGFTDEQIAGKTPHDCLAPDIADVLCGHYRDCLETGGPIRFEHVLDLPGGKRHWSTTLAPMRDPRSGAIVRILSVCRDISAERAAQTEVERSQRALVTRNEQVRSILDAIRDGYLALDRNLIVTDVNDTVLRWLDIARDDMVGHSYVERLPAVPLSDPAVRVQLDREGSYQAEFASRTRPGRWIDFHAYRTADGYSVFVRDITARRLAVQTLERTKGLLDATLNAMSAPVAILDGAGRIVRVNESWNELLRDSGRTACEDGVRAEYLETGILGTVSRRHALMLRFKMRKLLSGAAERSQQAICVTQLGKDRWYQVSAARFQIDGAVRIVVTHEDISAIHAAQETIKQLSDQLLNLQEEERQRIALDLHDSTAQQLTAIGLYLMSLRRRISSDDPEVESTLCQLEQSVEEAQREIRTFSYLLHPPYLEREGLKMTLTRFIDGYGSRTGLQASVQIADEVDDFTPDVQRALLRVVQEALANIHRHASATEVSVRMKTTKKMLLFDVSDNGKGMNCSNRNGASSAHALGLGLPGMQARVSQLGGVMKIASGTHGTTVFGRVPLGQHRA